MVRKVESFYWKQGQTNGKNNFKHILSLQGVKYVLGIIPIYTCILKQSKIQVRFDLLTAVEQSAHPIWGLMPRRHSVTPSSLSREKMSLQSLHLLKSEAQVQSVNAAVFQPPTTREGFVEPCGMHSDMLDPNIVSPLYILSQISVHSCSCGFMVLNKACSKNCKKGLFSMQNTRD